MKEELKIIMDLMEQLQDKMSYGESDFDERLGREKPKVAAIEIGMSKPEEEEYEDCDMEEEMSPDDKLERRLMKMRA